MRNCTLTGNQLFQDILSYSLPLIGCPEGGATDEDVGVATGCNRASRTLLNVLRVRGPLNARLLCPPVAEKYMKKLFGPNKDRMGVDQKAVLLVSMVNEHKRHGE